MTLFEDVGEFNKKFGLPHVDDGPPRLLTIDALSYRMGFLLEELTEFMREHTRGNLEGCADAIVDLVYVAIGTAHFMGIPFDECWDEVQRANMAKERVDSITGSGSKRGHHFDVIKPPGWVPPDHGPILYDAFLQHLD